MQEAHLKKNQKVSGIEQDGEEITEQAEKLHHALTHFRYEGKFQRGKNWKALKNIISSLERNLEKHRRYQEKILFPFLETHIPKYETTIHFLQSDHQEIQKNTQRVKESLKLLRHSDNHPTGDLQETGFYLVCLLRHHIQLEKNGIQKALQRDLNGQEQIEINAKIQQWFERQESPHEKRKDQRNH